MIFDKCHRTSAVATSVTCEWTWYSNIANFKRQLHVARRICWALTLDSVLLSNSRPHFDKFLFTYGQNKLNMAWLKCLWSCHVASEIQFCLSCITKATWHHYNDVIMGTMASQITIHTIVYSTICSGADQRKRQSSASLAFVWEIHRGSVNSPHKGPVTRKMLPFDDVIVHFASDITPLSSHFPWHWLNVLRHCHIILERQALGGYLHELPWAKYIPNDCLRVATQLARTTNQTSVIQLSYV